ncbi:MAG TPA: four helix bundle protein [Rhodanobacteraceae bacterium]|nr:four helix bundle protein [Rhodanobacteraceae bacterium]
MRSYRDLLAWQKAVMLVEQVYRATVCLPPDERYGLTSQLRRAAVSIPSNIAEGHGRETTREFTRFISIARGSLAELETQLEIALRLNMITHTDSQPIIDTCDELGRILRGLRKSLDNKLATAHH